MTYIHGGDRSQNQQGGNLDLSSLFFVGWIFYFFFIIFFWSFCKKEDVFRFGCKKLLLVGVIGYFLF